MDCSIVCVTGATGYIGSLLVKKLLQRGHIVHATCRNLGDHSKTGILERLPGASSRLFLFEADIYDPQQFEKAIEGCEFVFLVATPFQHYHHNSQYKDTTDAAVAAIETILQSCERSGSVKRVIYTGSVTASSPMKEDGSGFRDCMDESCWTPLNLLYPHCEPFGMAYTSSKMQSERTLLSYNDRGEKSGLKTVSLVLGLVGGDTLLPRPSQSVQNIVSPLTGETVADRQLKFLQGMLGSVPLVHVDDVCEAHVFCMEKPLMAGRFLCVSTAPTVEEIGDYYKLKHPQVVAMKEAERIGRRPECKSTKLTDLGFKYNYGLEKILDDSLECAMRLGDVTDHS